MRRPDRVHGRSGHSLMSGFDILSEVARCCQTMRSRVVGRSQGPDIGIGAVPDSLAGLGAADANGRTHNASIEIGATVTRPTAFPLLPCKSKNPARAGKVEMAPLKRRKGKAAHLWAMQRKACGAAGSAARLPAGHISGSYSITPNMMAIPEAMNA